MRTPRSVVQMPRCIRPRRTSSAPYIRAAKLLVCTVGCSRQGAERQCHPLLLPTIRWLTDLPQHRSMLLVDDPDSAMCATLNQHIGRVTLEVRHGNDEELAVSSDAAAASLHVGACDAQWVWRNDNQHCAETSMHTTQKAETTAPLGLRSESSC